MVGAAGQHQLWSQEKAYGKATATAESVTVGLTVAVTEVLIDNVLKTNLASWDTLWRAHRGLLCVVSAPLGDVLACSRC